MMHVGMRARTCICYRASKPEKRKSSHLTRILKYVEIWRGAVYSYSRIYGAEHRVTYTVYVRKSMHVYVG